MVLSFRWRRAIAARTRTVGATMPMRRGRNDNIDIIPAMRLHLLVLDGVFDLGLAAPDRHALHRQRARRHARRAAAADRDHARRRSAPRADGAGADRAGGPAPPAVRRPDAVLVPALGAKMPDALAARLAGADVRDAMSCCSAGRAAAPTVGAACTGTFVRRRERPPRRRAGDDLVVAGADVPPALSEDRARRVAHARAVEQRHDRGRGDGPPRPRARRCCAAQPGARGARGALSAGRGARLAGRVRDPRPPRAFRSRGRALRDLGTAQARQGLLARRSCACRRRQRADARAAPAEHARQDAAVVLPGPARRARAAPAAHRQRERRPDRARRSATPTA